MSLFEVHIQNTCVHQIIRTWPSSIFSKRPWVHTVDTKSKLQSFSRHNYFEN